MLCDILSPPLRVSRIIWMTPYSPDKSLSEIPNLTHTNSRRRREGRMPTWSTLPFDICWGYWRSWCLWDRTGLKNAQNFSFVNLQQRCPTLGQFHQHSTRSFYVCKFCAQLFLCLHYSFVLYWRKTVGAKDVYRTLLKLNPGRHSLHVVTAIYNVATEAFLWLNFYKVWGQEVFRWEPLIYNVQIFTSRD